MKFLTKSLLISALLSSSYANAYHHDFSQIFNQFNRHQQQFTFNNTPKTWQYIDEKTNHYVIQINLGKLNKEEINIELSNQQLRVSSQAQRETKTNNKQGSYHRYQSNHFSQSFRLPNNADETKISADFENSILKITIPRKESKKPIIQKIKIN